MLDIKFVRENPELVKENIRKKFKDAKLPLVDEAISLDLKKREANSEANTLRANRNSLSKQIGGLMAKGEREAAEEIKKQVSEQAARLKELETLEAEYETRLRNPQAGSFLLYQRMDASYAFSFSSQPIYFCKSNAGEP